MDMKCRLFGLLILVVLLGLLAACSPEETLQLTFDGSECALSGNADLVLSDHPIDVVNTSGNQGWMRICRADPGATWQDVLDFDFRDDDDVDEDPEWPTFCKAFRSMSVVSAEGDTLVYELNFSQDGLYFFLWEENESNLVWPCGPLTVVEAAAE